MKRMLIAVCAGLALASLAPSSAQTGRARPPEDAARRLLEKDERLAKKLTVETAKAIPIGEAIGEIHRQLGIDLAVQGDLFKRPLVLQVKDRKASDVLVDL